MREVEIVRDLRKALTRFNELWDLDDAAGDIAELAGYVLPEAISRALAAEHKVENLRVDCNNFEQENAALREALIYIYPLIAGRAIQLQQSGEEKAAGEWNEVAKMIYKAIEGRG